MRHGLFPIGIAFVTANPMNANNPTYRVVKQPIFRTWGINEYPSGRMVYGGFATKDDAESLADVLRAASSHKIEFEIESEKHD